MTTTDRFSDYDAAYVLGALSDADRAEYQRHLLECDDCAAAVRSLSAMPAVLATVPGWARLDTPEGPPSTLLPDLLAEVRRTHRRRRWMGAGMAAAVAACLVAVTVLVARHDDTPAVPVTAMRPVAASPMRATAAVQDVAWGTHITLHCTYAATAYPADTDYSLVVVDRAGAEHALGTWGVIPGGTSTFASGTALHRGDIREIQVRSVSSVEILQLSL